MATTELSTHFSATTMNSTWENNTDVDNFTTVAITTPREKLYFHYEAYQLAFDIYDWVTWFVVVFGLVGNALSIIVLGKMRPFVSSRLIMMFLAIVDSSAIIARFVVYIQPFTNYKSDLDCKLIYGLINFLQMLANWVLCLLTVERFAAVWFPMKVGKWFTLKYTGIIITVMSVITFMLNSIFYWVYQNHVSYHNGYPEYRCQVIPEYIPLIFDRWVLVDAVIYGLGPCLIVVVLNVLIIIALYRYRKEHASMTSNIDSAQAQEKSREQRQITIMLLIVSFFFVALVLPNTVATLMDYDVVQQTTRTQEEYAYYFLRVFVLMALTEINNGINFYLYFISGKRFRNSLLEIICRKKRKDGKKLPVQSKTGRKNNVSMTATTGVSYTAESSNAVAMG